MVQSLPYYVVCPESGCAQQWSGWLGICGVCLRRARTEFMLLLNRLNMPLPPHRLSYADFPGAGIPVYGLSHQNEMPTLLFSAVFILLGAAVPPLLHSVEYLPSFIPDIDEIVTQQRPGRHFASVMVLT